MPVDVEKLRSLISPREIPGDPGHLVTRSWRSQQLRAGDVLWEQGQNAPALGLLYSGTLVVQVDGEEIGRILAGDVLGETSAFTAQASRSATLVATQSAEVLLLPAQELPQLAQVFPSFHERLLDGCLAALAKRIRATDLRIATLSQGVLPAPNAKAPSRIARLWRALKHAAGDASRPPVLPLLRQLPGLANQPGTVIEELVNAFEPHAFEKGELLVREGEAGDAAFLLAVGEVQALRHVRRRMADVLAVFQPGDLFGTVTLPVAGPRTATCLATAAGWVYRMDRQAFVSLDDRSRLAWKACMVSTLGIQLRNANALLSGFQAGHHMGGPLSDSQFQQLLQAAGALLGTNSF